MNTNQSYDYCTYLEFSIRQYFQLECCGTYNYTDWYPILNNSLPISCCGPQIGAIGELECTNTTSTLWKTPCLNAMAASISKNVSKIGFAGFSIALIQVIYYKQLLFQYLVNRLYNAYHSKNMSYYFLL